MDITATEDEQRPEVPRHPAVARYVTDRVLLDVGLTDTEAALYRTLLDLPGADGQTLARRLDTTVLGVAKLIRQLARRGFVFNPRLAPGHYRAVDPDIALHLAAARREHEALDRLTAVGRVSALLPDIARAAAADRRHRTPPGVPVVVLASDAEAARVRADVAAAATTTLRRVVVTPATAEPLVSTAPVRWTVYRGQLLDDDAVYAQARHEASTGDDVRVAPHPTADLLIADDHTAVVTRDGVALLLYASPLLDVVRCYTDLAWERSIPFGAPTEDSAEWRLDDANTDLLSLLAAGMKDQAIARRLGIGLRTVVRRIGLLSRTLDAETRFQLALQARTRGLI